MDDLSLLSLPKAGDLLGRGRSSIYSDVAKGLVTKPISAGPNAKRWPAGELRQIVQARISGKTDDELRELVRALHARRTAA